MKKLISLLMGCSLALAAAALAQQPDEQQSTSKGKRAPEKARTTEAQPGAKAAKPQGGPAKQTGAIKERGSVMNDRGAMNQPGAKKGQKTQVGPESANAAETNVPGKSTGAEKGRKTYAGHESAKVSEANLPAKSAGGAMNEPGAGKNRKAQVNRESAKTLTPAEKQQAEQQRKGVKAPATAAKTSANPAAAGTNAVPPAPAAGRQNVQANAGAKMKKPDPQQVQQVKSQNANFRAQPKPQQVPAVTFNQNHRIEGSDRWQGQQYEVFRSYHAERHDEGWYHSHYPRVELIGGGYYYFNNGYWFPAWGYSPSAEYYAYDGPIYVGQRAEPPDHVIADVQALLQQMGYYKGEVDGLLGPLTREALTAYQADQGLTTTAVIDEPTLDSLGLA